MKSKNEEYLDSLLNSLKKDANSGIAKTTADPEYTSDLKDVLGNSSGSNDLSEIGEMLGKVDSGQLLDEGMAKVLDSIVEPAVNDAPTYTVGDDVPDSYEKDNDELALDEAIARAEAAIEEMPEIQPDDTDALLEVAPEIPIEDYSEQGEGSEMSSADAALDDMMRATPEDVLGVDFGTAAKPSDEMLNIDEMLDAGTGNSEELGLNDTLNLDGLEDIGGEAIPQEDLSILLDDGEQSADALSIDGLFDGAPSSDAAVGGEAAESLVEGEVGEVAADPSVDVGLGDISIDEIMAAAETMPEGEVGEATADPSVDVGLGDINIDEMMEAEPAAEEAIGDINIDEMMAAAEAAPEGEVGEVTAEPSLDAGLGDINIDEMMVAEPAPEGDVGEVTAEPSADAGLGDISIDEMMVAAEAAPEGAVGEATAEPSIDAGLGDISIDEMMAAEAEPEVMPDEISLDDMLLEESGIEDSSIEEVMGMDVSAEPVADGGMSEAEPVAEKIATDEISIDEPVAEEMPTDEIVVEEPVSEEAAAEDVLSIDGLAEEVAAEEPVIEEAAEEMSAADALEGEVAVEEMILDEEVSGDAPAEEVSGDAPAEDAASAEETADGAIPDEMLELDQLQIDRMLSGDSLDEAAPEAADDGGDEFNLDDLSLDGLDLSLDSPEEVSEESESGEDVSFESVSAELDNLLNDVGEGGAEESLDDESMGSESELDSMLADLGGEGGAEGNEPADVDMPDLDAIMNSLASDDVEDLENTAHIDEKEGANAGEISLDDIGLDAGEGGEEVNPEDIMEALEGDGLDEIGLSDDIPDPDEVEDNGGDYDEISLFDGSGEPAEGEEGGKKKKKKRPNIFILILAALFKVLTQTDEDLNPKSEEDGLASLTDENQQVLDELAAEDGKKAKKEKKKKEKKEKPKKEPKPKKEKKPKPPKEPKPKKEKKKKVDDGAPEKALAPKKVAISMIFAISLGLLCCIPSFVLPGRIIFGRAQTAYEHGDYKEAYKLLYGKQLNEEQALLYNQARVLANVNHYLDSYNNYIAMNMKDEAVDSLLIGMRTKNDVIAQAEEFQVAGEVESVYSNIESILTGEYGLTLADVEEVNKLTDKAAYTKRIMEIAGTLEDFIHPNG